MKKHIFEIVKVNEKGQITIPKKIRVAEGIVPNDLVKITFVPNMIFIDKIEKENSFEEIVNFLASTGLGRKDWKEIQKEREESER
jgi:AbrB family looped-hinge helix DNA binding protein